jgi:serine protease Do
MKSVFHVSQKVAALSLAGAVVLAGSALAFTQPSTKPAKATVDVPLAETPVPRDSLPRGSFAPVVSRVAPGVVKIVTTTQRRQASNREFPSLNDPFWRRFFGDQSGPMRPNRPQASPMEHGLGSGVIVTKDGYILTNNHVVDGAKDVKVTLQDGREFTAKVVGRDPKSDIAVVKIEATDLPIVAMADSDKVQVGDVVLAIGNPFGVGQTVTQGIVSATDRGNMGIEDYENFIQTDAAINPGNSGGALVDIEGRLVGINTAILSRTGGNQGVGFAIPSNLVRTVMDGLVKEGRVSRGYLGIKIQNVTSDLEHAFNLKGATGALVGDVVSGGPAAQAGLKPGDVIVKFNDKSVKDSRHLQLDVAAIKPGSKVPIEILRDGNSKTLEVTVKVLPGEDQVASANSEPGQDTGTLNGVTVANLDPSTRSQLNIPKEVNGAVVTQVEPESPAAQAGLKSGDVIQEIDRHPVKNANEAVRLTEQAKDKRTLVRVWAEGGSRYVVVDETQKQG